MIHDIESTAKRLFGFMKKHPNPAMTTLLRWLIVIEEDQQKDRNALYKSRFEGFSSSDKGFLMRYEAEINILLESGNDADRILELLKNRFKGVKKFPTTEILVRFMNRMEALNG